MLLLSDIVLHYFLSASGRYASFCSFGLRTLCIIIFFPPPDVMLHYTLFLSASGRYASLFFFPPPDGMLHYTLFLSASGRYASFCSFRLRTLCFIIFFPPADVVLHDIVVALGHYAALFSFRLRTLCFSCFFPPPDVMLHHCFCLRTLRTYASWYCCRLRTLRMLHYFLSASGRYASSYYFCLCFQMCSFAFRWLSHLIA